MYSLARHDLCRTKALQRFAGKAFFSFFIVVMSFLLSGCINWAHVIENNHLRVIEINGKGSAGATGAVFAARF
jgi:hypothetical protein